ncbi:cytochrome P450 [Actinomadura parmotrematis]|uniref:Cytochrome P450 n=1 Tax=Actinomadura parmotrematis TaxID=2864039 RepID=A0ABS7FX32_9ACTN|nr:cytochrome P450 [Actinomadura parmotrematis]MBW8484983.1 cytochrome P450 [Actinomadura parmotrematis]
MEQAIADPSGILGFDPFDPAFHAAPYARYREIAARGPLARTAAGLWVTASYDLCGRVLRDPGFGHRPEGGAVWRTAPVRRRSFLTLDPPDHTRLRRLVGKAFTARLVERLRPRIAALVDELLGGLRGEVDLIAGLAYPLPVILISELLGVPPEDRDRFKGWSDILARGLDPDFLLPPAELAARDAAREEFAAYFRGLAARRRAEPRDDLLSALVAVPPGDDALTEEELLATCVLLLVAGHETTVNLIGNGTLALLRHPDQLAWLRAHPEAMPAAVEELLRYDPPVQLTLRTALADTELAGHEIAKGQLVLLLIGAANRDPAVFADPDRLDLARYLDGGASGPAARHLAFGLGIHFCLGAPLARLEGELALRGLLDRDPALLPGAPAYRANLVLRGLAALPVALR